MRFRLGILFGFFACSLLFGVALLSGCDDDSGTPSAGGGKHAAAPAAANARVGPGWLLPAQIRDSVWGFQPGADAVESIRPALDANRLPPRETVRIEALLNRFAGGFPAPEAGNGGFRPAVLLTTTPWNDDTLLLVVAIEGGEPPGAEMPRDLVPSGDQRSIWVEFNAKAVEAYRPLGDPMALPLRDGATRSAAMLYEISLPRDAEPKAGIDYATLHVRYRDPADATGAVHEIDRPVTVADFIEDVDEGPDTGRFLAAIAGFGGLLRGDPAVRDLSCDDVLTLARGAASPDPDGSRAELIRLIGLAEPLIDQPSLDTTAAEDPPR
jgi:hypothetical protein